MTHRAVRLLTSVFDPRTYLHACKLLNFYNYSHLQPRREMRLGSDVRISPNASFRNGTQISIEDNTHIGERCMLWAGDDAGSIQVGSDCLFGPEVMLIATNYRFGPGIVTMNGPQQQQPIRIGNNVWLGAKVIVTAGVSIGDNAVIGAGSVVTRSVPANSVAAGVPARILQSIDLRQPNVQQQTEHVRD